MTKSEATAIAQRLGNVLRILNDVEVTLPAEERERIWAARKPIYEEISAVNAMACAELDRGKK